MSDVVIRRCDVRVVRHGGWSWGPDPRRLLDEVLAALPGVLAGALADLRVPPGAGPLEITRPLRVVVPLRSRELAAFAERRHAASLGSHVAARVRDALVAAGAEAAAAGPAAEPSRVPRPAGDAGAPAEPAAVVARLVAAAHRAGRLRALLHALPRDIAARWVHVLLTAPPAGPRAGPPDDEAVARVVATWTTGETAPADVRARLAVCAELLADHGVHPADVPWPDLRPGSPQRPAESSRVDAPAVAEPEGSAPPAREDAADVPRARPVPRDQPAPPADPAIVTTREAAEGAALPFLLLGPLAGFGFLDAVAAQFGIEDAEEHLPALAAALAYKVLTPPERGWRRSSEDYRSAALFAARAEPVPEPAVGELARHAGTLLAPAAATVAAAVLAGEPGAPVLVHEPAAGGVVAATAGGLAPIAWGAADDVAGLLAAAAVPAVFVGPGGAAPPTYAALQAAGLSYATDAPPARGEHRRRLRGRPGLWGDGDRRAVARAAAQHHRATVLPAVVAAWAARPAAPLGSDGALDRSVAVAAGAALAVMAMRLWGAAEPTDPVLMLQRMGDLSAWVRFDPDRVRVLLPLGRRRADLFASGLMENVAGVPWLGGRLLEFGGG